MKFPLFFRPEAEADLIAAFDWYEDRLKGLGKQFTNSVESTLRLIQSGPKKFPQVHKHVRRALLRRFPYGIFYLLEEDVIVVLAVFHQSRDPEKWRSRGMS